MQYVDKFFNVAFKNDADKKKSSEQAFIAAPSYDKPGCGPLFTPPPPPPYYSQEQQRATLLDDAAYRQSVAEWYLALRRRRLLTSLCAALLILWLLFAAIAGSLLLFKYMHRKPVYYGWCGTTFLDETFRTASSGGNRRWNANSAGIWKSISSSSSNTDSNTNEEDNNLGQQPPSSLMSMRENLEIDEANDYEKIEVPQFGPYRPALFVHDFRQNLTAIIDVRGENCFIKPLDRSQIVPPSGFIDMIRKVGSGYYDQNSKLIREVFDVRLPALSHDQLTSLNSWIIKRQCYSMTSYMLQRSGGGKKQRGGGGGRHHHYPYHHKTTSKNRYYNDDTFGKRRVKRGSEVDNNKNNNSKSLNFIVYNGAGVVYEESLNIQGLVDSK